MRRFLRRFWILGGLFFFALLCATLASPKYFGAHAPTLVVTNTNDSGPGSLRQAIADADIGDTIQFDPSLNGHNITLTSGELVVSTSISINGPGPSLLGISAYHGINFRILHLTAGHTVVISGLTISNGLLANDNGAGILNDFASLTLNNCAVAGNYISASSAPAGAKGVGIYNTGTLSIVHCSVRSNTGQGGYIAGGGGIANDGSLTITQSDIEGNFADVTGGGILNNGMLMISDSTVSNNQASWFGHFTGRGGGIYNGASGTLTIQNTTISGNKGGSQVYTGDGGGVFNENGGVLSVINSTISGNTCFGNGGGIYGSATITNCTISGNTAPFAGGGIYAGSLEIGNTILKTGSSGGNIACSIGISHGYNLSNDDGGGILTAPGDQINTDPMLGPFRNNGGLTFTHTLSAGSPAIDAGDPNFSPPPLADQRGYVRIYNGRIDIGALEAQITIIGTITYCAEPHFPPPVPNVTLTVTGSGSGSTLSDGDGNYAFLSLPFGGNYTVTPTKAALTPGSAGINTIDVVAVQRHYLQIAFLSGCPLQAADVNGDFNIDTIDVVAIQRFYLVMPTGTANVGNYEFFPASRSYQGIVADQTGQNYSTLIFGDVISPFAD